MRIKSLAAKNYRALEEFCLTFPTDYCTISGHNNAGKSSLIKLLQLVLGQRAAGSFDFTTLNYTTDRTQWGKEGEPIDLQCTLCLSRVDDLNQVNPSSNIEEEATTQQKFG